MTAALAVVGTFQFVVALEVSVLAQEVYFLIRYRNSERDMVEFLWPVRVYRAYERRRKARLARIDAVRRRLAP